MKRWYKIKLSKQQVDKLAKEYVIEDYSLPILSESTKEKIAKLDNLDIIGKETREVYKQLDCEETMQMVTRYICLTRDLEVRQTTVSDSTKNKGVRYPRVFRVPRIYS